MLKQAWAWVIYSEKALFRKGLICLGLIVLLISCRLISSMVSEVFEIKTEADRFDRSLTVQRQKLSGAFSPQPKIFQHEAYGKLAKRFDLAMDQGRADADVGADTSALKSRHKHEEIYFAGSTENILALLHCLLDQAYLIKEFQLEQNAYKTLLVIVP